MKKRFTRDLQRKLLVVEEARFIELLDGVALDEFSDEGNSILHFAARRGFRYALNNLIREGADPTKLNNEGKSIAHIALENGHVSLALEFRSITRTTGHQSLDANVQISHANYHSTESEIRSAADPKLTKGNGYLPDDYLFSPEEDPKDYFDRTHKVLASGVFTPVSNVAVGEEPDFSLDVEGLASGNGRLNENEINSFDLKMFEIDKRKTDQQRRTTLNIRSDNGENIQRRISNLAIEDSPNATKSWKARQEIPDVYQENFLDFLDSSPTLDASDVAMKLNKDDHSDFTLFATEEANEALAQARTISPEAAEEFKDVCFLLGENADATAILSRIEEKFGFSEKTRQRREADQLESVRLETSKEESEQSELGRIAEEERRAVRSKESRLELERRAKERLEVRRRELVTRAEPFVGFGGSQGELIKKDHQDVKPYQKSSQTNLPKEGRSHVFESLLFSLIFFLILVFFSR